MSLVPIFNDHRVWKKMNIDFFENILYFFKEADEMLD